MDDAASSRRKKTVLYASPILLVLIALLLSFKYCGKPDAGPFDYFRAKAAELGFDPGRVAKFVADDVKTLSYKGNVKGALATLWEGAGSPEEKAALSDALLAHCRAAGPSGASKGGLSARIAHRGARETTLYEGPIGDLVGDVHSLETVAPGKSRVTLRTRLPVVQELDSGAEREEIVFRVERPDGEKPLEVARELWHKDNRRGPVSAIAGDRHDFVVLPCRIGKYVREKEEHLLQARGRDKSEEASGYLALLDYGLRSDLALADLERDLGVRARFDLPRILILSRAKVPGLPGGAAALDLRLNRVTFEGGKKSDAYLATQVRSFVESGLEQHYLTKLTGQPCTSAYDLFNRLNDDYPNSYDRRLALLRDSLAGLGDSGRATFRARKDGPTVTVNKTGDRYTLSGARIAESVARQLAGVKDAPKLGETFETPEDAAVAVELALMGTGAPPNYALEVVELSREDASLVAPGARFSFRWGEGDGRTEQTIEVTTTENGIGLQFLVRSGLRPAQGWRFVTKQALSESGTHNPWYRAGEGHQDDATSFCVSRKVFQRLRDRQPVEMSLQARTRPEDEENAPRQVAWKGPVSREGEGVHRTLINGREGEIRFVRAKIGDAVVALLDDPRFPVGMADKITEIRTTIRARLVDESGLGIAGADVEIAGRPDVRTGPDGRFLLPPILGKAKLTAKRGGETLAEREVDLTAPGLSEVSITVPRLRKELLFIAKDNVARLDALDLSAEARRHLDRYLKAGYHIVIPSRKIEVDGVGVTGYYAHDPASGEIIGVTEEGLHGTSDAYRRALASLARDLAATGNEPVPFAHVHMLRGAILAWWVYSKERIIGAEHEEAIEKMLDEMDDWEKSTNLLAGLETIPNARGAMSQAMSSAGWGVESDGAAAAFKIGYLGSTAFLHRKLRE